MLLFPDILRDQHHAEEFVFAAPCDQHEWHRIKRHANKIDADRDAGVTYLDYFVFNEQDEGGKIIVLLRGVGDTDDDCLATAAYIRMVNEFTGMIYALPYHQTPASMSMADIIARTAGVPPKKVRHVELPQSVKE